MVVVEALVLDGDHGVLHGLRDALERHLDAVLGAVQRRDQRAVGGEDLRRLRVRRDLRRDRSSACTSTRSRSAAAATAHAIAVGEPTHDLHCRRL